MKRRFFVTLSILALSCHLPNFFCLLSCSRSTSFEGSWSSPCWFAPFVHDRRSFRGHSSLTLPTGAWAWGPVLLITSRKLIFSRQCWVPSWRLRVFDKSLLPRWDEVPCVFDVVYFSFITGVARRFPFSLPPLFFCVRVRIFSLLLTGSWESRGAIEEAFLLIRSWSTGS